MALLMNDAHIIYHHMDVSKQVGFARSYSFNPDYLVVQSWFYAAVLYPDSVLYIGPQFFYFTKNFPGVGQMQEGTPCHHIIITAYSSA